MKIAAIYARVSSDKQRHENTIDSQVKEVVEFGLKNSFNVPSEFIFLDDGYSGSNLRRPALEKLRDSVQEGQIETVLAYAPDRLARNYVHQELLREEFKNLGVNLLFVKSPVANTPEERFMIQFQGMIAEYERELIIERTRRGRKYRAKSGCVSVLSSAPFGYRYINKTAESDARYEIIESEAMIVREVFRLYVEEKLSLSSITMYLRDKKITNRKGSENWSRTGIRSMIINPAYSGMACYGKTIKTERSSTPYTRRKKPSMSPNTRYKKSSDRETWIPILVPAIIDKSIFDQAQDMLEENKHFSSRNTKEPSLLQGLLVCASCGKSYIKRKCKTTTYYSCISTKGGRIQGQKRCKNGMIRQEEIDRVVWEHILTLLQDPHLVQEEIERRLQVAKYKRPTQNRESVERELLRLRKIADSLLDAYQEELLGLEELRERMPRIKQKINALEKQLKIYKAQEVDNETLARVSLNIENFLLQLSKSTNNLTLKEKQQIIRLVVKQIIIGKKEGKGTKRDIEICHCIPSKETCDGITDENLQLCSHRQPSP